MIHTFAANVQIQLTTGQVCCQTVKDHLVSIRPPWSLLAYDRKPGLPWHSAFSQIHLRWFSLCQFCEGNFLGTKIRKFSCSVTWLCFLIHGIVRHTASWEWVAVFQTSKSTRTTVLCVSWLSSERGSFWRNEGGLLAQPRILSYWSIHHVLRKKKFR